MEFSSALKSHDIVRLEDILNTVVIDLSAKVKIDNNVYLPLDFAVMKESVSMANLLITHGAEIDQVCENPVLHIATSKNDVLMIKFLVSKGADPNIRSKDHGHTPLHIAAKSSSITTMEFLLSLPDVNCRISNKIGNYPEYYAPNELMKKLLRKKRIEQDYREINDQIWRLKLTDIKNDISAKEKLIRELGNHCDKLTNEIAEKMQELDRIKQQYALSEIELTELRVIRDRLCTKSDKLFVAKESSLECICCCEVPFPPKLVFQCVNGHSYCSRCARNMSVCPQCRTPLDDRIRNRQLEQIIAEQHCQSVN